MKIQNLKVIDIIQMPLFEKHVRICIDEIWLARNQITARYGCLKRGAVERLIEKGVFGPKAIVTLYAKVLDKTLDINEYPSTLRKFIKSIGDEAFHRTYVELKNKQNEKDT